MPPLTENIPLVYSQVKLENGPFKTASGGNHDVIQFDTVIKDDRNLWFPTLFARSATVVSGGAGYVLGEILTDVGVGNPVAQFTVTGVLAGAVTSVSVLTQGVYDPLNALIPINTSSNLAGAGCTLYVLWGGCGFVIPNWANFALCKANVQWESNANGRRQFSIRKNYQGLNISSPQNIAAPVNGDVTSQNISSGIIDVIGGDILTANVIQTSGVALNVQQSIGSWFQISLYQNLRN